MTLPLTLLPGVLLPLALPLAEEELGTWPWWRGPDRNGISAETGWLAEGQPEALWRKEVGLGYSSVTVGGGRLYTMGYDEEAGLDRILCLDARSGEELWSHAFEAEIWNKMHGGGTLSTPSLDDTHLFAVNREGNFFCMSAESGEVYWTKNFHEELSLEYPTWGYAASPFVLDDSVVQHFGRVISIDKGTGDVRWASKDYGHAYSTPTLFELPSSDPEVGPRTCMAVFASQGLAVIDLTSGEELYFHEWKTMYDINAATPVVDGNRVFISSGLNRGCAQLLLGEDGVEVLWESKVMRNKMSGCVLYEEHLYGFDESIFKCIDTDGNEKWKQRGLGNGAFLVAGDRLVLVSSKGELVVAEASSEGWSELSRTKVLDGGVYWTSPVLVDGLIYVRNSLGQLVCLDHRAERP
ncbi:MAG: PQQ-binding-like beta-propeller repeat protein [Planctomycetota bacterium]